MSGEPWVLVVAGRDPSGGAGVDADLEALEAVGVGARTVVATETDQDRERVRSFAPRPLGDWWSEVEAALARGRPAALKVGLVVDAEHFAALGELARGLGRDGVPIVVDPVLAASGGERFVTAHARSALLEQLVARGVVLTPNVPEAAELTGAAAATLAAEPATRLLAAEHLLARGAAAVVLKGGHGAEDPAMDLVLARGEPAVWHTRPRVRGGAIRGSGCRFASYLAGALARGRPLPAAAEDAGRYVAARILAGAQAGT